MKYKYKKGDIVYMIFAGKLLKGIIEKRYKDEDGENCYFVDFRSSNSKLSIVYDIMHIQENVLFFSYQALFSDMVDDLKDRLEYKGLKL
jgi:ribosomal protein L21E